MPKYINEEKVRGKCSFCNRKTNCFERRGSHWNCWELDESFAADVVEVKHGKWVEAHDTSGHDYERCTECGTYIEEIFFANDYDVNFCPNCGADMRGETNG